MHILLFLINSNNFERFKKKFKSITFKVDKIFSDKSTDSNVFNGCTKINRDIIAGVRACAKRMCEF